MNAPEDDPLLSALGALPEHDVEPPVAARIARRARAELAASARTAPWLATLSRFYARLVEAPLVLAACALYLVWLGGVLGDTGFSAAERARHGIDARAASLHIDARQGKMSSASPPSMLVRPPRTTADHSARIAMNRPNATGRPGPCRGTATRRDAGGATGARSPVRPPRARPRCGREGGHA
jgi:hypothetical protein